MKKTELPFWLDPMLPFPMPHEEQMPGGTGLCERTCNPVFWSRNKSKHQCGNIDNDNPYGVISGALPVYPGGETETVAKNLIQVGEGDVLQFLCDYYDYKGNYQDSYALGDPLTLGAETEIANTPVGRHPVRVMRILRRI